MNDKWYIDGVMRGQQRRLDKMTTLAAQIVRSEIVTRTPVATGNLKGNTSTRRIDDLRKRVFNNTEYAGYVEFGTVKMGAQPFMRPGYRAAKSKVQSLFKSK